MLKVDVQTPDMPSETIFPDHRKPNAHSSTPLPATTTAGALNQRIVNHVSQAVSTAFGSTLGPSGRALKPWGFVFPFDQPTPVNEPGYTNRVEYDSWHQTKQMISELVLEQALSLYGEKVEVETDIDSTDFTGGMLNVKIKLIPPVQWLKISLSIEGARAYHSPPPKNLQPCGGSWAAEF